MPAGISALAPTANGDPFERERKDPSAFTILQKDGLDTNLPLLHVNGDDRPIERNLGRFENGNNNLLERKRISRSNDHLVQASLQSIQTNPLKKKPRSRSQESSRSLEKVPAIKPAITLSTEDFNEVLNAKLKRIQELENEEERKSTRRNQIFRKKPFITTVKTGEFLMPPPEVAALLGIGPGPNDHEDGDGCPLRSRFKSLVSLAKKPEVRHNSHNARCRAALKATVDFTLGMMNATTMAAATLDERTKIAKKSDATLPWLSPALPKKLEPIKVTEYSRLFEKPEEFDVGTQTEYFLDRPPTPRHCPEKIGEDASTQIEPNDLFDFDFEVQPILEKLVGKTVEQALIEVLEEEEIAALREQQRKFLELRAAERAEARRLEEQERRIREEKDQRLKQYEKAMRARRESEERVAAATLLTGYIAELLPAVLEGLKMSGFLLDEIKADVEEGFVPWLMKEVKKEMGNMIESRELLMEIIREILENRAETYRQLGEEYDASRRRKSFTENLENVENGNHDPNFVNYRPPVIDNMDVV
ncbi:radial spoke head protein 3 isoform X2 [Ptiloglossa arizonensis]|uniref:radial spoke head protein 3 isoform X2 n=1 Tax=Ptiloglossa arizonensis TaxID=3350558 RepID=UPI003FA0F4C9